MDVHHIRYFLAVCETLNFTRAAENCGVTQPALSRAIQQLEDEVGGPLFRRERNLTHPTDLAVLLKPRLQQIADGLGDAQRQAQRFLTMGSANVTLGIMCTVGPARFTGLLSSFQMSHPGISLHLVEGVPTMLSERLQSGEIDLAIMASPSGFPEGLEAVPIYRERFLVAFANGHRLSAFAEIPVAEVDGESYLNRMNCEYGGHFDSLLEVCGCAMRVVYQSEREDWIQNLVAGGLGICFIPEFSALVPGVQTRPVTDPEVWRDICLIRVRDRETPTAVDVFARAITQHRWL